MALLLFGASAALSTVVGGYYYYFGARAEEIRPDTDSTDSSKATKDPTAATESKGFVTEVNSSAGTNIPALKRNLLNDLKVAQSKHKGVSKETLATLDTLIVRNAISSPKNDLLSDCLHSCILENRRFLTVSDDDDDDDDDNMYNYNASDSEEVLSE